MWRQRAQVVHGTRWHPLDLHGSIRYSDLFRLDVNTGVWGIHLWASCGTCCWKTVVFPGFTFGILCGCLLSQASVCQAHGLQTYRSFCTIFLCPWPGRVHSAMGSLLWPLSHCSPMAQSLAPGPWVFYRLNVFVPPTPPKFLCQNSNSQSDGVRRWGLWEFLRSRGWSLHERD